MKKAARYLLPLLLTAALCACQEDVPEVDPPLDSTEVADGNVTDGTPIMLVSADAGADYLLVRTDTTENFGLDESRLLQSAVEEATGHKLALKTDWYKGTTGAVPTPHEILIGKTNREETIALMSEWRRNGSNDWSVRLVGEKLLIYGETTEALRAATEHVIDNFVKDGTLTVPENYSYTYTYAWKMDDIRIGENSVTEYSIVIAAKASETVKAAASKVQAYILENLGIELSIRKDTQEAETGEKEILVGATNRLASAPAKDCATLYVEGSRLILEGDTDHAVYAAASLFTSGETAFPADTRLSADTADALSTGVTALMKSYVDDRAKLGRKLHLDELRKIMNKSDILDEDVYGNYAVPVLYMPADEVTDADIAFANKIVRKVCGYRTTDIPPSKKDRVEGEIDFAANRIVRALYAPEGRVEAETLETLKRFFLNDDFESCYYSENHMLMFRTARYLAACCFEDETFNQYKMSGAALRQQEHDYLVSFLQYRAQRGWGEFDSMGYTIENFLSMINLFDCAPDEDLRTLAQMTLDSLLMNMIVDSTENGMYGGAHGRSYDAVATDMRCRFFFVYQLYFGEHGFDDVPANTKGIGISNTPLAFTSSYRPHDILYAIVADKNYPFANYEDAHNPATQYDPVDYGVLSKYTYNTELYSIGCVTRQDPYPRDSKEWKNEDTQQTNWSMVFAENSKASLTVHHPGGTNGHNYWYGDSECNCNHLFGHENTVMGIFFIPGMAGEYNYLHAHVEKNGFSEVIEDAEKGEIFVRMGDAYAALRFSDPYNWKQGKNDEILIYDGTRRSNVRIAMACEAGDKAQYGSFEAFVSAMREKTLDFDRENLTLSYGNLKLSLDYNKKDGVTEHSFIDGKEISYPYGYVYNSPMMQSKWDSGVIEMYYGATVRVMDFMNVTDTTKKK